MSNARTRTIDAPSVIDQLSLSVRLGLKSANPAEWLALRAGLVPVPAAEAWGGMGTSGVIVAAVRTGITARLAEGHATADKVAADLGLDPLPTRLLLDCLRSAGQVTERSGRYRLSRRARRWLDPASPLSVADYVAGTADYWPWWGLALTRPSPTGTSSGSHEASPDDPYWRRYAWPSQRELARLSAAEIAHARPAAAATSPRACSSTSAGATARTPRAWSSATRR